MKSKELIAKLFVIAQDNSNGNGVEWLNRAKNLNCSARIITSDVNKEISSFLLMSVERSLGTSHEAYVEACELFNEIEDIKSIS